MKSNHSPDIQFLAQASELDIVGVVPVGPAPTWDAYQTWVAQGYAAEMAYLARPDAITRRQDPRHILPETQSMLVVTASYASGLAPALPPLHGRVSRYAWGEDYHRWLLKRLKSLVHAIEAETGPFPHRCYVDTGPILERAWAYATGLGWIGKNTNLIHPRLGSFIFLGVALLGIKLLPTSVSQMPSCGSCTRCLEACPTGALVAPGVLDARRCIAYLTIEHRGPIPVDVRSLIGDRVFGCDTCQDVCPWNRKPLQVCAEAIAPTNAILNLHELLTQSEVNFRTRFRHTPIWRATRRGLARNAAVVLGNSHNPAARSTLARTADAHPDAMVREHAAWALAQL